jgi:uncharacterized protein
MSFRFKSLFLIIFIICLFLVVTASFAVVPPIPQMPPDYVVDLAGIIDENVKTRLNRYLQELEQKTSSQVVILTVTSLEGESIEEFSISTAHDKWKLGQKGKDNGVLLIVAFKDRKYRFEIGYGLESVLPDSLVGSIGRKYLVPYFQKGDYSTGIYTATLALINEIASKEGVEITGMPKLQGPAYPNMPKGGGIVGAIFAILFLVGVVILFIKYPRLFIFLLLTSSIGGRRGSWGGGGGFGGGGGGFGGGGASGGW